MDQIPISVNLDVIAVASTMAVIVVGLLRKLFIDAYLANGTISEPMHDAIVVFFALLVSGFTNVVAAGALDTTIIDGRPDNVGVIVVAAFATAFSAGLLNAVKSVATSAASASKAQAAKRE